MLQDIEPHRLDMGYAGRPPADDDFVILLRGGKVLRPADSANDPFPRFRHLKTATGMRDGEARYLLSVDGLAFFTAADSIAPTADSVFAPTEAFRDFTPSWLAFAAATALHLAQWYAKNRFCGSCGSPTRSKPDERAVVCPDCGNTVYPTISPVVIVGVADGDNLLMTRYANRPYTRFALVAGFVEAGETLEGAVRREVMEEVGVRVRNIRYYKSQPWPFSSSVLMGFYADLDGPPDITLDTNELQEGTWIARQDIPPTDASISLTGEMIETFRTGNQPG